VCFNTDDNVIDQSELMYIARIGYVWSVSCILKNIAKVQKQEDMDL